jgi:hypothetical protein
MHRLRVSVSRAVATPRAVPAARGGAPKVKAKARARVRAKALPPKLRYLPKPLRSDIRAADAIVLPFIKNPGRKPGFFVSRAL